MRQPNRTQMRVTSGLLAACALTTGLAFAGCGESSTQSSTTNGGQAPATSAGNQTRVSTATASTSPAQASNQPVQRRGPHSPAATVAIAVSIPGLLEPEHQIPKRYTCDGEDVSLPVQWTAVPHDTAELAVFILNLRPVNKRPFFDWAVAGLSPTSQGISAGALPAGAVVATNSFGKVGYSICPKGTHEHYVVRVVALPRTLTVQRGVDASALYAEAEHAAEAVGVGGGVYTRP
jgi:phosphatidylethanolamine-binding protein (PEBP) family uncharacterized protein